MKKSRYDLVIYIGAGIFIAAAAINLMVFFGILNSGWRIMGFGIIIIYNVIQIIIRNNYMTQNSDNGDKPSRIKFDKSDYALIISTSLLWLVTYVITGS